MYINSDRNQRPRFSICSYTEPCNCKYKGNEEFVMRVRNSWYIVITHPCISLLLFNTGTILASSR